jgi:hypothetical protein
MNVAAVALTFLLAPLAAQSVERQVMCFTQTTKHPIQLEFTTYEEMDGGWAAGRVKFKGGERPVGIVFQGSRALADYPDHPSLIRHTWIEVRNERITGRYQLTSQGAVIESFRYKDYVKRRDLVLVRDYESEIEDQCAWK